MNWRVEGVWVEGEDPFKALLDWNKKFGGHPTYDKLVDEWKQQERSEFSSRSTPNKPAKSVGSKPVKQPEPAREEQPMETKATTKKSHLETAKSDANKAKYRVIAKQLTKAGNTAMVAALGCVEGASAETATKLLNTNMGQAFVSELIGWFLTIVEVSDDPRVATLAEEFRVAGLATAGDEFVALAYEHLTPVLTQALKQLPAKEE